VARVRLRELILGGCAACLAVLTACGLSLQGTAQGGGPDASPGDGAATGDGAALADASADAARCAAPTTDCGGACVDVTSDPSHCGACGNACEPGATCAGGACTCALDGLVAYYPLDADLLDHSGNGHTTTASGVTPTAGKLGGAYAFDGVASVMHVGGSFALSGARTYCAWVSPITTTGLGQPVFVGGASGAGDLLAIQSSTPGGSCTAALADHLFLDHWGTACGAATMTTAPAGAFRFVCFAYDGSSTSTHFADGATESVSVKHYAYDVDTVTIGSNTIGGTTVQAAFKGAIDEVTIWSRALPASDMTFLYAGGKGCRAR
jgi:hypothetical protein